MKLKTLFESNYGNNIALYKENCIGNKLPTDLPTTLTGYFNCNNVGITSLEGCPSEVGGGFSCNYNMLTSLEGCPSEVSGGFYCYENQLTSLEGCPSEVSGEFRCSSNKLTSLKNIQQQIKSINGNFNCSDNKITSHILGLMLISIGGNISTKLGNETDVDQVLNKWKNQGRKGVMGATKELTDLGYDDLAQL